MKTEFISFENAMTPPVWCNEVIERDPLSLVTDDKSTIKLEVKHEPLEYQSFDEENEQNYISPLEVVYATNVLNEICEGSAKITATVQSKGSEPPLCQDQTLSIMQPLSVNLHLEESADVDSAKANIAKASRPTRASTSKSRLCDTKPLDLYRQRKNTELLVKSSGVVVDNSTAPQNSRPEDDDIDFYLRKKKTKFTCKLCNKTFSDVDRCRGHVWSHRGLKPFACTRANCKKTFASKDYLQNHIKLIHIHRERFKCDMCKSTFNRQCRFTAHLNKHKGIPVVPLMQFDCAECGKTFSDKYCILKHIINMHSDRTQHLCEVCGKVFHSVDCLKSHRRVHKEKRYKCEKCNMHFQFPGKLSNHMASHSKERPFQCDICSKTFRLKSAISRHISMCHQKKKVYKCPKCEKSFQSRDFWKEHVLKHEGIRKYSCETCGKTFAQSSHLAAHKFSHGEKKFVCSICGAKFNRNDNMKSHVKRHETKKCPN